MVIKAVSGAPGTPCGFQLVEPLKLPLAVFVHTNTVAPAGPALMIDAASKEGIGGHFTALGHEPHHYTMFYVQVDDIEASLAKAASLGGKMVVPKVDIPTGSFAWFSDPDGNVIGLWKPAKA